MFKVSFQIYINEKGRKINVWIVDLYIDFIHFYEKEGERGSSNFSFTQLLHAIQISSSKTAYPVVKSWCYKPLSRL